MSFLFKAFGLAFLAARAPPRTRAPGSLHVGHEPQVSQPSFAGDALGLCCGLAGGAVAAISSRSRCRPKALVSKRGKCVRPAETSSKGTTKTVPKVLVVNLDRSPQRWESAQVEFAREGLQAERFSGTDGKALKPEELKKVATFSARWLCTKGMIGCFLSHRRIWQKMVSEKLPAVVVLEDDVRLVEGFSDKLLKLMDELPADWEVCLLGAIGNINPDVEPFHMKLYSFCVGGGRPSPGKTRRVSDNVFVPHRPAGTYAYLVSLKGAERLVKELPLACYHVDLTAWSLPNLKLYAAVNQIATQDFEAASTVSKSGAAMTSRFLQWAWTVSGLGAMGKAGGVPNLEWAWKAAMFAIPVPFTGKRIAVETGPTSCVWVIGLILAAVWRSKTLLAVCIIYQGLGATICRYLAGTHPTRFFLGHLLVAGALVTYLP